ncbi:MAG: hypothetical protein ACI9OH_000895 [Oleispira sp.]|jgi:hypothetical protein
MIIKLVRTYFLLLFISVLANYLLEFMFEGMSGLQTTFIGTLYCSAIILLVPFFIAALMAGIYKLVKRRNYKYYWQSVWIWWAVIYIIPFIGMYIIQPEVL